MKPTGEVGVNKDIKPLFSFVWVRPYFATQSRETHSLTMYYFWLGANTHNKFALMHLFDGGIQLVKIKAVLNWKKNHNSLQRNFAEWPLQSWRLQERVRPILYLCHWHHNVSLFLVVLRCSLGIMLAESGQHIRDNAIKDRTNKKHLVLSLA